MMVGMGTAPFALFLLLVLISVESSQDYVSVSTSSSYAAATEQDHQEEADYHHHGGSSRSVVHGHSVRATAHRQQRTLSVLGDVWSSLTSIVGMVWEWLLWPFLAKNGTDIIVETETLSRIQQVNEKPGFGDLANKYAFSMASFGDHLFVGTLHAPFFSFQIISFFFGIGNIGPLVLFNTGGSKIYRGSKGDDGDWTFTKVHDFGDNNYGTRKMLVVRDYLYAVTANHVDGLEVWQTSGDGSTWVRKSEPGLGTGANISGRSLVVCGDYLYVGVENRSTGAQLWRHELTENGDLVSSAEWEDTMTRGLGDQFNYFISELLIYKGKLYASTLNGLNGAELWRTSQCEAAGAEDIEWENVVKNGLGNRLDFGIITLQNLNDNALLLGTVNYVLGSSLYVDTDGSGDSFEPLFQNGFTSRSNGYVWASEVFHDRLYIGTFNSGSLGPWSTFHLFSLVPDESRSKMKDSLTVENQKGFSSRGQYGIRNMVVHDGSLMIGTAGSKITSGTLIFEATTDS